MRRPAVDGRDDQLGDELQHIDGAVSTMPTTL